MTEPLLGDPDDLRRILEAVDLKNELAERQIAAAERLANVVNELHEEVKGLRGQIHDRPTKAGVEHKRRRTAAAMLLYGVIIIWGHDVHIEHCGPGARAEAAVQTLIDGGEREAIEAAARGVETSKSCDLLFPLHDHDDNGYPHLFNVLGWGIYGAAGVGIYLWQRRPKDGRRSTDPEVTS